MRMSRAGVLAVAIILLLIPCAALASLFFDGEAAEDERAAIEKIETSPNIYTDYVLEEGMPSSSDKSDENEKDIYRDIDITEEEGCYEETETSEEERCAY